MSRVIFLFLTCCFSSLLCFSQNEDQFEDKFLIVLDMQEYYTNGKLPVESAQKLIDSINYVIEHTNSNNVIYVKSSHKLLNLSLSYPFIFVSYDTSAMRLDKRINLLNEHIFTKDNSNVFTVIDLNEFLIQNKAKEIIIVGLQAEECVFESLIGGKELGYVMYVIPEAIIGESQKSKDKAIKKLKEEGIKVLDIKDYSF